MASQRPDGESFVVSSRDVTEAREARTSIERERALYESVVEGVNDAVAIVRDGVIVYANPQCHEVMGVDAGGLVGEPFSSVVAPADRERVVERYRQRLDSAAPDPPARYDAVFVTADGDQLVGEVNATQIDYEGDDAVLVAIRDVTDRVRYESALETRNEQLEALNRVVRHDIRNDMTVILGWAELLEAHVDEEGRSQLEKVLKSSRHVVELTDIAHDFIETLTSEADPELRAVPLRETLGTELELAREFYPDASLEVDGELPDIDVRATEMLSSVFGNLLRNGVQHNPAPAPSVVITASVDGECVVVRVADDGPGIPDAAKDRIFGKGEKGLDSEGTGIGLYLVRTLVEQFGGEVHVEDNEPEGAVFVVRLQIAD
ncbi:MAG: PAS domain-containing sensor histidine kinase [Halobacteriales archaeon]|nr:PAS domain-containing sensor histidine kinase [Halobacteriales archaeon]